ncbi:MAG: tetratricopeptide repeat protein [Cyanothece sp. SIO1E1]|nr:tetratricopeptide repeat protein [Cyanothece sp. SIO1E1]
MNWVNRKITIGLGIFVALGGVMLASKAQQVGTLINWVKAGDAFNQGVINVLDGDHELAVEHYSEALQIDSEFAQAYAKRGASYYELKNYELAVTDYERALEINPDDAEAYAGRCLAHYRLGNYPQAQQDCTQALITRPDDADAFAGRGLARYKLGRHGEALTDFAQALQLDSKQIDAYVGRALTTTQLGNYLEASEDYQQALTLNSEQALRDAPDTHAGYFTRSLAHYNQGNQPAALQDLEQALQMNPEYDQAYVFRGLIYEEQGNYLQAIADHEYALRTTDHQDNFGIGVQLEPDEETRGFEVVRTLDNTPAQLEGLEEGDRILAIDGNATANMSFDDLLNLLKGVKGTSLILSIRRDGQDDFDLSLTRGWRLDADLLAIAYAGRSAARYQLGNRQGAVEDCNQVMQMNATNAQAYLKCGVVRRSLGDRQGAIKTFEKASELFSSQDDLANSQQMLDFIEELGQASGVDSENGD